MNIFKLSILCAFIVVLAGCKDDEPIEPTCTAATWVGTYVGTQDCDGDVEDVTVTIAASGTEAILVSYETATFSAEFIDPLTTVGCTLDGTSSDLGLTLTVDADLDGDALSFIEIISDGTDESTCTIIATRQ